MMRKKIYDFDLYYQVWILIFPPSLSIDSLSSYQLGNPDESPVGFK